MAWPLRATAGIRYVWRILSDLDRQWREVRRCAPMPLARWSAAIGLVIWCAAGPAHTAGEWFSAHYPWLIVVALLVFGPEVASLKVGSFRMDLLQQTMQDVREDVEDVRGQLVTFQLQLASQAQTANQTVVLDVSKLAQLAEDGALRQIGPLVKAGAQAIVSEHDRLDDAPGSAAGS